MKKDYHIRNFILLIFGLIAINFIGVQSEVQWDWTEDNRYTLSSTTEAVLEKIDDRILIDVYLTGDFPAVFKRLEQSTRSIFNRYERMNLNLLISYENPSVGSVEEVNLRREELAKEGLSSVRLNIPGESLERRIYPYAALKYGTKKVYINLLESERSGTPNDQVINESIALLEYKITSGLLRLFQDRKKNVLFTEGHGELQPYETADLEQSLRFYFNTGRVNLDSIVSIPQNIDVVVVAQPKSSFSDREKFIIDQYIMNGGKMMFLLDPMRVDEDSLRTTGRFVATDYDLGLNDILYKYGVRLQSNLILSLENTRIPLEVGQVGGQKQFDLFPWYYYIASIPNDNHMISRGLERVRLTYGSVIDTVATSTAVTKTPLLFSGPYSRYQFNPVDIDLNIVRFEPDVSAFNHVNLPMAMLLEGQFESLYKNRVSSSMEEGLASLGQSFQAMSKPTKIMVVSDGDIAKNEIDPRTKDIRSLGYDRYEQFTFGNKPFLLNAVEYLTGLDVVLPLRAKDLKLRLLDQQKVEAESSLWQAMNFSLPIVFFLMMSFGLNFYRKRKYQ
ncbi:gliding motility-associated ABC transporter substrate-binding protein GldG [Membranihabitans marinus]|uniref:gliding motility-associated ABC transporter substrate-binding protein GldG n=1 Tax=Membranihabitans marinus TaxID=1227546 RepID=UPI001F3AE273|nr:gliding motility-associated ABC transporter substrate-binding protein GldG [Membranihabitans marinus]